MNTLSYRKVQPSSLSIYLKVIFSLILVKVQRIQRAKAIWKVKDITNPEDKLELRGDENFPIYRRIYYKEGIQKKTSPQKSHLLRTYPATLLALHCQRYDAEVNSSEGAPLDVNKVKKNIVSVSQGLF